MAEHQDSEKPKADPQTNADAAPEQAAAKSELPVVVSPSISSAIPEPVAEPVAEHAPVAPEPVTDWLVEPAPTIETVAAAAPEIAIDAPQAQARAPRFFVKARYKRNALLAASVVFASALGAIIGALSSSLSAPPPRTDVAAVEEHRAMEKSIAHLSREVATLKSSLEAANKAAHSQIAKINARLAASSETTGSIPAPKAQAAVAPVPTPRPAPRIAAAESHPMGPRVVPDWSIRAARDGAVFVERHGEIYQVVVGAPLPGLGPVEAIRRQDGRWMVVTPKGIIVSLRDRHYFE